jgi:hypothetical protein
VCAAGNTNALPVCQALFAKKMNFLVLSPSGSHFACSDTLDHGRQSALAEQQNHKSKRFGMDPETGRLAIAGWQVPMPRSRVGRIAVGSALVLGGVLGFLPILGFWMVPLGFVVLSHDLPFVRRQRRRLALWWARRRRKS